MILLAGLLMAGAMQHQYAEVNGVKLHYVESGKGELVLFLHGFPEFWYGWRHQLPEVAKTHRAVAMDMRGYNLSSKPGQVDQYAIPQLVEDVRSLAAKLNGGKKFTLVGHDWGGVVAWVFASMHADMLDRLIIINAPHPTIFRRELANNPAQQKASEYMVMFRSDAGEKTLTDNNNAWLNRIFPHLDSGERKAYNEAWSQPGAITGGLNYYRASALGPIRDPKAVPSAGPRFDVAVPTLVIHGEKDTAILASNLDGLDQYVAKLTIKRIPDAGHWVAQTHAATVNDYIRDFLRP
ncbi:MAG: alpha/beta hydrolase [Bryobacteraceae bacterium]|nr:alpha/beta hydrolase [Bryobacteraceae bacterium]